MAGDVVGRELELATIERALDTIRHGPTAVLLSGDAGIGKTTVWRRGLAGARERGYRTLSCSPVEAETRLSYAVLGDLVEPVLDEGLPLLPEPQRAALEVALLRTPRTGGRADQRAVSLAVLGCIRAVASTTPVVLAIDDAQWMDLPSARVLQFVVPRLKDEPVGVLTAVRGSDGDVDPLGVVPAFPAERVHASMSGRCHLTTSSGSSSTRSVKGSRAPRSCAFTRCPAATLSSPTRSHSRCFDAGTMWGRVSSSRSQTACRSSSNTASGDCRRTP